MLILNPMKTRYILLFILLIATGLRAYFLDYDLPELYEEATPMRQAWEMWHWEDNGFDFNPHFFNYPALTFYIHFITQAIYLGFNLLIGRFQSPGDIQASFNADPSEIVLLARAVTLLFGLGAVWQVYRLGKQIAAPNIGLIAASAMAVLPLSIHTSRTILVDTPLLFFTLLSLIECIRLQRDSHRTPYCGIYIGLAAACKYTGAMLLVPYLISQTIRKPINFRAIGIGIGISGITFLLASPYCLIDFSTFWKDFTFERMHMAQGHFGIPTTTTTYLNNMWSDFRIGLLPMIIGFAAILKRHLTTWIPLIAFSLLYLIIIATWSMQAGHYLLPLFPILTLFIAQGIDLLARKIHSSPSASTLLTIAILIPTSVQTIQTLSNQTLPSTRALAKAWIQTHVPHHSILAMEPYTPDVDTNHYFISRLPMDVIKPEVMAPFYDLMWYNDFDFIITSDGVGNRYRSHPTQFAPQIRFYYTLEKTWPLKADFGGSDTSGPHIRIYRNPHLPTIPKLYPPEQYITLEGAPTSIAQGLLAQLAHLYQRKEWRKKAIDVYEHLLILTPNRGDLYAELGTLYYESGLLAEATRAYLQALQQNSTEVSTLTNLGNLYFQQNQTPQATTVWERALAQAPANLDLINNLIFIYKQQNRPDLAIQILRNALKHRPNDPAIQSALAELIP